MQWIDEIGMLVWERLIELTRSLPLLLVSATRPESNGRESARLRDLVVAHDGHVMVLGPLDRSDTERIVGAVAGAEPGPTLRSLTELTGGNPLYARELAHGLMQQQAVRVVDGFAEVDEHASEVPRLLLDTVRETLAHLHPDRWETLRHAALLGTEFTVADVAAFTGRAAPTVETDLRETNVVVDSGGTLTFRPRCCGRPWSSASRPHCDRPCTGTPRRCWQPTAAPPPASPNTWSWVRPRSTPGWWAGSPHTVPSWYGSRPTRPGT
ncbi:hypothetical protein [Actinoplanes sp. CA-252034]|uniref:hypothetical protein n=1 Tax=Actinoplanes sp. CA-252034 TaxID=3239906 RepID=UPI003D9741CD